MSMPRLNWLLLSLPLALAACNTLDLDTQAPEVTLTTSATVVTQDTLSTDFTLNFSAKDERALKKVELYQPGVPHPIVLEQAPFNLPTLHRTWTMQDVGVNTYKVVATDMAGNVTTKSVDVEVKVPVTIKFWTWYLSPSYDKYIKSMIYDFYLKYPYITVEWQDKAGTLPADLKTAANGGTAPEVVNLNTLETLNFTGQGMLYPVTDYTRESTVRDLYYAKPLENFTDKTKIFGYPWYGWFDDSVIIYNKKIFADAGVSVNSDEPFANMDELINAAKKIKYLTNTYGFAPAINDPYNISFLRIFQKEGIPIVDSKGRAVFANPENIAASAALLKKYSDLYPKIGPSTGGGISAASVRDLLLPPGDGYMPAEVINQEAYQLSIDLYKQGKLAMVIGGPQGLNQIKAYDATLYANTGVIKAPKGAANVQLGGGMDLVLPKGSKYPKAGAMLAEFVTNNANQMKLAKMTAIVPTTKAAATDPYFQESDNGDPIRKASNLIGPRGAEITTGLRLPSSTYSENRYYNFNQQIYFVFFQGKDPATYLNNAQTYWNSLPDVK